MASRLAVPLALSAALLHAASGEPGAPGARPPGLPAHWDAKPLGQVRVSEYTHVETRTRLTSSGYVLRDKDEGLVCAVSRDWWRSLVQPGDLLWVQGFAQPCVALDTMAPANSKGFPQRRWIDIYVTSPARGRAFGIRRASAYLIRPKHGSFFRTRTPAAARRLHEALAPRRRSPARHGLAAEAAPPGERMEHSAWTKAWLAIP